MTPRLANLAVGDCCPIILTDISWYPAGGGGGKNLTLVGLSRLFVLPFPEPDRQTDTPKNVCKEPDRFVRLRVYRLSL